MHMYGQSVNCMWFIGAGACGCCGSSRIRKYGRFNHRAWSKRKTLRTHRTGDCK